MSEPSDHIADHKVVKYGGFEVEGKYVGLGAEKVNKK